MSEHDDYPTRSNAEITARLMEPFDEDEINNRIVGGGTNADFIPGEHITRRLIDVTDNTFDVRFPHPIQTMPHVDKDGVVKGTLAFGVVELTIHGLGTRAAIGVQVMSPGGGEDLLKGIITDGTTKAAKSFGVGRGLRTSKGSGGQQRSGGGRGGKGGQQTDDVASWRTRIEQANAAPTGDLWAQLVRDCGDLPWKWIELAKHAPNLELLDWLDKQASRANRMTTALAGEIERRRAVLKKPAAG